MFQVTLVQAIFTNPRNLKVTKTVEALVKKLTRNLAFQAFVFIKQLKIIKLAGAHGKKVSVHKENMTSFTLEHDSDGPNITLPVNIWTEVIKRGSSKKLLSTTVVKPTPTFNSCTHLREDYSPESTQKAILTRPSTNSSGKFLSNVLHSRSH